MQQNADATKYCKPGSFRLDNSALDELIQSLSKNKIA